MPDVHVSQLKLNKDMFCLLVSALKTVNKYPFHGLLSATFFVPAFCGQFCYLEWLPSLVLESCLLFLKVQGGCAVPHAEDMNAR